ncbi:hypothetical protein HRbin26_01003 [bacterium HR26]|nr:hypothetical protein HRbin26_01003 [bacterium HR26]
MLSANLGFGKLIDTDDERVEPLLGAPLGLDQGANLPLRRGLSLYQAHERRFEAIDPECKRVLTHSRPSRPKAYLMARR